MGISFSAQEAPPSVVLVPPLIDSRQRGRSRFAKSSYDRAFGQQALRILFDDFLPLDNRCALRFTPPEDRRISVAAKLHVPQQLLHIPSSSSPGDKKKGKGPTSYPHPPAGTPPARPVGMMTLRYQPDADVPWTFCDVKARAGDAGSSATVRGCFMSPATHLGGFAVLPLGAGPLGTHPQPQLGLRYSHPSFSAGAVVEPTPATLASAWGVARAGGFIFGVKTEPGAALALGGELLGVGTGLRQLGEACMLEPSWGVAYRPEGQNAYGKGVFTTSVELRRRTKLAVTFLHHLAVQRVVHNPLEKSDVVGITNYLDLAFQMVTDLSGQQGGGSAGAAADSSMRLAAAWQANKNVMVKARLGLDGASFAAIFKSWWQPSFTLGVAATKSFTGDAPRLGITLSVESDRSLRYERAAEGQLMSGGRVTQRHVASDEDVAYREGRGLLVPLSEVNDPDVMGQRPAQGDNYL